MGADDLRAARARRAVPRRLVRRQRRRRGPARPAARLRQDHRHHTRRFRQLLSIKAVQSGIHALEESSRAGMAGEAQQDQTAVREGMILSGEWRVANGEWNTYSLLA